MMKRFLVLAALMAAATPAHAAITIGALTQLCGYDANGKELAPSAHASCQSYIAGIIDYNDLFKSVGKTNPKVDFCLPPALTYADLQRIVLEYLQKSRNYQESPAAAAVVMALKQEFPCDAMMIDDGFTPSQGQALQNVDPLANDGELPSPGDVLNTPAP